MSDCWQVSELIHGLQAVETTMLSDTKELDSFNLFYLPTELVTEIISQVHYLDLPQVRLASHALNWLSAPHFFGTARAWYGRGLPPGLKWKSARYFRQLPKKYTHLVKDLHLDYVNEWVGSPATTSLSSILSAFSPQLRHLHVDFHNRDDAVRWVGLETLIEFLSSAPLLNVLSLKGVAGGGISFDTLQTLATLPSLRQLRLCQTRLVSTRFGVRTPQGSKLHELSIMLPVSQGLLQTLSLFSMTLRRLELDVRFRFRWIDSQDDRGLEELRSGEWRKYLHGVSFPSLRLIDLHSTPLCSRSTEMWRYSLTMATYIISCCPALESLWLTIDCSLGDGTRLVAQELRDVASLLHLHLTLTNLKGETRYQAINTIIGDRCFPHLQSLHVDGNLVPLPTPRSAEDKYRLEERIQADLMLLEYRFRSSEMLAYTLFSREDEGGGTFVRETVSPMVEFKLMVEGALPPYYDPFH
ncbi:hypothetical protein T439DRAFT_325416 [Meredithblackwellia eburnea MCA 4105]